MIRTAAVTRALGGGLLALATVALVVGAIVGIRGFNWLDGGSMHDAEMADAGADLVLFAGGLVAAAAGLALVGGFLFILGSSLLRRYEARSEVAFPLLP